MQLDPRFDGQVTRIAGEQAAALVESGATVLDVRTPDELVDNVDLLPASGRVLDVACGRGRHALLPHQR